MLTMNEFKEAVTKDFKRFLDESFKDKEMVMYPLYKMNIAKTAISFKSSHEGMSIMPVVYLEDMYQFYKDTGNLNYTFAQFACTVQTKFFKNRHFSDWITAEYIYEHVYIQLVGNERNTDFLKDHVHIHFMDLSVIFRIALPAEAGYNSSYLLRQTHMDYLQLDMDYLLQKAIQNYENFFGTSQLINILDIIPKKLLSTLPGEKPLEFYVLTTQKRLYGASIIYAFPETLAHISSELNDDLYILPSSIHEVLILKASERRDVEGLREIVCSVNEESLPVDEILSDSVYYYSRKSGLQLL